MSNFRNMIAALLVATAMPGTAMAADWWWVAGEPGSDDVWFVDADTIRAKANETSFRQLHLTRAGTSQAASLEKVRCSDQASGDAVHRFVCATAEERVSLGAMLGPMPPEISARIIFETPAAPSLHGMAAN